MVAFLNISLHSIGFLPNLEILDQIDHGFHHARAASGTPAAPVTVLGVDDWPWRMVRRYGTILCGLERRCVIDLLPDRSADTLAAWLPERRGAVAGTPAARVSRTVQRRAGLGDPAPATGSAGRIEGDLRQAGTGEAIRTTDAPAAVRLLAGDPDRLADEDRRFVQALRERSPSIATAADLITRFCEMVKSKVPDPFDGWLREAEVSALSPFTAGIGRDEDAVRPALSEPWSSGQVEGQVNRLKAIKRTMYGRAGFDLLHARVLGHA